MEQSKTDIQEELVHQQAMKLALRKRLRILELQMAQHGSSTSPHILTEITALNEQIQRHDMEMTHLETLAAEDTLSLADAEYRVLLAESWNTTLGYPNVIALARLELARLQLGIAPEHATELEQDIRAALAREIITSIHDAFYTDYLQGFPHTLTNEFWLIGRAIRLHVDATIEQFCAILPPQICPLTPPFAKQLLDVNQFWLYQHIYINDFNHFIAALPEHLRIQS